MTREFPIWGSSHLLIVCVLVVGVQTATAQRRLREKTVTAKPAAQKASAAVDVKDAKIIGHEIRFADGSSVKADAVWKSGGELWYRTGGMTQRVGRAVKSIEPIRAQIEESSEPTTNVAAAGESAKSPRSLWVVLKGGARMKVDELTENEEGAWCRRGNLSVLVARERIDRIERDDPLADGTRHPKRDWTTGINKIDQLIRANADRFGVDPYLVFCVMEHESQFRSKAVSPKGAQGLMQLMPGTAARFGVRNPFDPAQNILGGTQYLRELLQMFNGRVDLALASYNAGEGAVLKYGRTVPPYRETREYVQRISRRYGVAPKESRRPVSPSN